MNDSIAVHILQPAGNLIGNHLYSFLAYVKTSGLDVVEQISTGHILKHHKVVLGVFKQVYKTYNILMLANLKYFDFSPLLENFDVSHVLLLHLLDGYGNASLQVLGFLNKSELAFPKCAFELVKVQDVAVAHNLV